MKKREFLRIDEVAEMFGVHPKTVVNWWRSEKTCLIAWRGPIGTKGLKFSVESVCRFKEQGIIAPQDIE